MASAYHRQVPAAGQTRAYLALTLVAALWGSYPAFAKIALLDFPPFVLVSLRSTLAAVFLAALLLRRGGSVEGARLVERRTVRVPRLHRTLRLATKASSPPRGSSPGRATRRGRSARRSEPCP